MQLRGVVSGSRTVILLRLRFRPGEPKNSLNSKQNNEG